MSEATVLTGRRQEHQAIRLLISVVWLVVLCSLFYYKWGSAGAALAGVRVSGRWAGSAAPLTTGDVLRASVFYFRRIWIALTFGLVIAAMVRAFVSPRRIVALFGGARSIRSQIACGVTGAPLMLCSCCVTPVFQSVYEAGARLSSALTLMLSAPGLNPAALLLTFLLFPAKIAWARLCGVLTAMLLLPRGVERLSGVSSVTSRPDDDLPELDVFANPRGAALAFLKALGHVSLRTIPYIVIGVTISSLIVPWSIRLSTDGPLVIAFVAVLAVLVALPTFFELPLALLLAGVGAPGAAAAMLVAGPIVNLPSLAILWRETTPGVALGLAAGVWLIAVLAGMTVR
jgi:uncharacterized membrane protein YraQ (UPF0718 family)